MGVRNCKLPISCVQGAPHWGRCWTTGNNLIKSGCPKISSPLTHSRRCCCCSVAVAVRFALCVKRVPCSFFKCLLINRNRQATASCSLCDYDNCCPRLLTALRLAVDKKPQPECQSAASGSESEDRLSNWELEKARGNASLSFVRCTFLGVNMLMSVNDFPESLVGTVGTRARTGVDSKSIATATVQVQVALNCNCEHKYTHT